MSAADQPDTTSPSRSQGTAEMVLRIAVIIFVVEALVMMVLPATKPFSEMIVEGLLDSTLLTALSAPLIYWLVTKPYQALEDAARKALREESSRLAEQARLLQTALARVELTVAQNDELRSRLQLLSEQIADLNERSLQRVGADLHDGPAQLLSYAMLRFNRIDELLATGSTPAASKELKRMRVAIEDSLREVRNLSAGLSLPELKNVSLESAVKLAIASHEEHTNSRVHMLCDTIPTDVPEVVKISIYRFIQEGLSNAFRHGGGKGQCVRLDGDVPLIVTILDDGPGISESWRDKRGLGLVGIQARIEAIGGRFAIQKISGGGTQLTASFCETALRRREVEHV
jgi:signal transduction histidine kinase